MKVSLLFFFYLAALLAFSSFPCYFYLTFVMLFKLKRPLKSVAKRKKTYSKNKNVYLHFWRKLSQKT